MECLRLPLASKLVNKALTDAGPDGIGDHRVHVEDQFFVGHSAMSPEATSNLQYLCRAHPVRDELLGSIKFGSVI